MPNFKDDKSKFTMKNMNYYKGKHAESEANSPYNKNGGKLAESNLSKFKRGFKDGIRYTGATPEIAEELVNVPLQNMITGEKGSKGGHEVIHNAIGKTGYTPQTESRKDISTDVTPQTQKGKPVTTKEMAEKVTEMINWAKSLKKGKK